jgi:hypothetical protein
MLASWVFTLLCVSTAVAMPPQSDCAALNAAKGEGKFTGQISTPPDGSSMTVTYGDQSVLVHYNNSVSVCQGGQPASLNALAQGASVSVFGPLRRNGKNIEIDAARIFVAGRPQTARPSPEPVLPNAQQPQTARPTPEQAQQNAQQTQLQTTGQRPIPNSVILGGGNHAATMQRLHVVRTYALPSLRANSQVTLGEVRLDFRPMLDNPKAPFNVAQRLREMPQHVQVQEDTSEVSEVEQGLVIHHVLSYRILPGKCDDPDARAQLSRAGIECFTRASAGDRMAEFSKPGTPHYVADPMKRQAAISALQRNSALADADANKGIADLRKTLANPSQREAISAQIGQAETARLGTLTDDQLKEEMINSAVQRVEETMFVPKLESANYAHPQHPLVIAPSAGEMEAAQKLLREGVPEHGAGPSNFPKLLKVVPITALHHSAASPAPGGDKAADFDMGPYVFLTGFTVGHDYEWSWGVSVTINWCVLGCSSTYSINLHAGFNYGFGLRFPIQTQFKYHTVVHANNSAEANLTATFVPIEGTVDDFFSAGLSGDQMYDGKELVAQVGADAGFDYNLPVVGSGGQGFKVGVDFTDLLPAPYTHGKFLPPAPGAHGIDSPYVFNTIDLLGDLFNFGAVGGAVYPAVNVNLHSNKLEFTLNDEILRRQTRLTKTGQTVSLGVSPIPNGNESHFSIGNPVYNLGFTLTPGLAPTVFVDVAVWSNTWTWPVWFPQLAVDLPPNGIDFGCHAGTTCVMDFTEVYDASTGQVRDVSKEADVADRTLTGGGCQLVGTRTSGQPGKYLCPVKGMLGLCQAMLKNDAVSSCGALVPNVVDEILKRGHCTGSDGAYVCPKDMVGLCDVYLKNQEILSCKQAK